MALKGSTYKSVTSCTKYFCRGVTFKSRILKNRLKIRGHTQAAFAAYLGMNKKELLKKLYKRRRFNQSEVTALVRFMGAREAIEVIWFPSLQIKRKIQHYVLGGNMFDRNNYRIPNLFGETSAERRRREIEEQARESGEDWDQSEEFQDFIFDSDELPSRKFMRRRNG